MGYSPTIGFLLKVEEPGVVALISPAEQLA